MLTYEFFGRVKRSLYKRVWRLLFRRTFRRFGKNVSVIMPMKIEGAEYIELGDGVVLNDRAWLLALKTEGLTPALSIGAGTYVGHFVHIVCLREVRIGQNVLIADKVYISDNLHGYQAIDLPVIRQPIEYKGTVAIGDGSWLGENVCIVGATVGKHCVVGANSVLTADLPDYSVATGIPARVIKRYNHDRGRWEKTSDEGEPVDA